MAFWGINLDAISMINLIMSIGFSVDFAAHISYSYMDSDGSPNDRVRNSLYSLGLPICQGAISTILGVIGLMIAPSYIFVTFFKMVFLVIILGALHGLFLLPVLLSLFGPGSCSKVETEEKCKTKSPTTSYLSDGESATPVPAKLHEVGDESEMRIPRPTSHTNHHNHHSSHHTDRREHRRGKREHQVHVAHQPPQPPLVPPHGQEGAPTREAGASSPRRTPTTTTTTRPTTRTGGSTDEGSGSTKCTRCTTTTTTRPSMRCTTTTATSVRRTRAARRRCAGWMGPTCTCQVHTLGRGPAGE